MPLDNQIFAKLKRILPSPDGTNEYYIVIERDKEIPKERLKEIQKEWGDTEVIITITALIKNKHKRKILRETMAMKEDDVVPEEQVECDPNIGKYDSEFEGEGL